jgi:ribosome-binding factor A
VSPTRRSERLAEEIREEVASIVAALKDPRVGFVTVTRVGLTADLRTARVYVGVLGGAGERDKSLTGLRQAAGFIRRELGRRIRVRHVPELRFEYDEGIEATERVARLLEETRKEPAAEEKGATGSGGAPTDEPGDGEG